MSETKIKTVTYSDLLLTLCDCVKQTMTTATANAVKYTPMVQSITKTTLTPDIGTFVMFTGSFSGMVVINFPKETAMELYRCYMSTMGIDENEQARNYTSEEVSNALGELMNQILGHFTRVVNDTLHTSITQSQPKMLALPRELQISISVNLDNPRYSKITFYTASGNVFFLELAMDNTEFNLVREFEEHAESPDELIEQFQI